MDLKELREQIDIVDKELTELLTRRMDIAHDIALWKREQQLPALDARREREKVNAITEAAREDMEQPLRVIYSLLFELSRTRQNALLQPQMAQIEEIRKAIAKAYAEVCLIPQFPGAVLAQMSLLHRAVHADTVMKGRFAAAAVFTFHQYFLLLTF